MHPMSRWGPIRRSLRDMVDQGRSGSPPNSVPSINVASIVGSGVEHGSRWCRSEVNPLRTWEIVDLFWVAPRRHMVGAWSIRSRSGIDGTWGCSGVYLGPTWVDRSAADEGLMTIFLGKVGSHVRTSTCPIHGSIEQRATHCWATGSRPTSGRWCVDEGSILC